ncbi:conserved Plasmodium protein, unknown function [Plasmodium chabaudi chabaudi]|uniref:Uncharacterized protein n=1 Tax=Plasmodium chabaudi chabaudi TaxID=31271 RepID=A0A1D3LIC3_PLACU|nr:conserved Plasmodium protein, unknown function [Plasmodium chabaudi chabaudi]
MHSYQQKKSSMDELDKFLTYEYIREYLFKNNRYDIPLGEYHKVLKCREGKEGFNKKYSSFDLNVLTLYDELIDIFRYNNYFIKICEFTFLKISRNTYQGRSHISFGKNGSEIKTTNKGNKKYENNGTDISTNIPLRNKNNNNEKYKENDDPRKKEINYNCIVDGNKVSNIKDVLKDTFDALIFYMIDKYNIKLRMNHSYKIQEISNYSITNEEVFKFLKNDNYYRIDLNKLQYDINDYSYLFYKNITQFIDFFKYMKDIHSCAYLISLLIRIIADKNKIQKYSSQLFFCKRNDECISNLYINYVKQNQDNFQKIFFNSKLVNIHNIIASKISLIEEVKKKIIHRKDLIYPDELVICSFVKSFYNFKPLNPENENNKKELAFQKNKILPNNPPTNNVFSAPYHQDLQNKKTKKISPNEIKSKGESINVKDGYNNFNESDKQLIKINIENEIIDRDNLESTVASSVNNINAITDVNNTEYPSNESKKIKQKNGSTTIDSLEIENAPNNTNNSKNKSNNEILKESIEDDKKSESTTKSDKNKLSCYEILKKRSIIRCSTRLSSKNVTKDDNKDLSNTQNKNSSHPSNSNRPKNNNRSNNNNNNAGNKRNDSKRTNSAPNNKGDNKYNSSTKEGAKNVEKKANQNTNANTSTNTNTNANANNKTNASTNNKTSASTNNKTSANTNPQKNNEKASTDKNGNIDSREKSNNEKEKSETNSKEKTNTDQKKNDNEKDDNVMKTDNEENNGDGGKSKKTENDLTYNNDIKKTSDYQTSYKNDDKYLLFNKKRCFIDSYEETDESEDTYDTDDLCDSKDPETDDETASDDKIIMEKILKEKNANSFEQDRIFNKKEKIYNKKLIKKRKIKRDKYCESETSTDDYIVYNNWDSRNINSKKNKRNLFSKNGYTKTLGNDYDKYRKQKYLYDKYMRNSNYKERVSNIMNMNNIPFWGKIPNFSNPDEFTNISNYLYMLNMHNINNRCKCNNIINDYVCLNSGNHFNDTCIFSKDNIGLKKRKLYENNSHEYNMNHFKQMNKSNSHLQSNSFIYNNKNIPKFYTNNELSPSNKYINYNDEDSISIKHIKRHMNTIGKNKNIYGKSNSDIGENCNKIKNRYIRSMESNSSMDYEIDGKHKKSFKRINSNVSDHNWINKESYKNSNKSNIEMMGRNKNGEHFMNNEEEYSEYEERKKIKRRKIIEKNNVYPDQSYIKNKQYYCQGDKEYEINKRNENSNHILTPICNKIPMKNEFYSEEEKQEFDNINIIQKINEDFCYLNNNDKINVIKILCSYRAYLKKILSYEYMKQDFSFEVETCIFYLDYINYNNKNRNNRKDEISDKINNQDDSNYSSTNSNEGENNIWNVNSRDKNNNLYYDIDRMKKNTYQNKPYNNDKMNDHNFLKNRTNKKGEDLLCNSFNSLENDKKNKLIKKIASYTNKIKALHQIITSYTKINLLNIGKIKNYIQIANCVKRYPYYFYYNEQLPDGEEPTNEQALPCLREMGNEIQNVGTEKNKYAHNNEKKPFDLFK